MGARAGAGGPIVVQGRMSDIWRYFRHVDSSAQFRHLNVPVNNLVSFSEFKVLSNHAQLPQDTSDRTIPSLHNVH